MKFGLGIEGEKDLITFRPDGGIGCVQLTRNTANYECEGAQPHRPVLKRCCSADIALVLFTRGPQYA